MGAAPDFKIHFFAHGQVLASYSLDLQPAREWTRLDSQRRAQRIIAPDRVEPIYHPEVGAPCVTGFRVHQPVAGGEETATFAEDFLQRAMQAKLPTARQLLPEKERDPATGTQLTWICTATPRACAVEVAREESPPPAETAGSLAEVSARAVSCPEALPGLGPAALPLFVTDEVIAGTVERSRLAGRIETGGALVGHLRRDPHAGLYLEVTGELPARHTQAGETHLTFTVETWNEIEIDLARRGRGEHILGWYHSHSFLKDEEGKCQTCDKRDQCTTLAHPVFFSGSDLHVHRTNFMPAYSVALVVGESSISGLQLGFFGWQPDGSINRIPFTVIAGAPAPVTN